MLSLPVHCEQPKPTDLDVDDDLSLELESDELFFMAEAASTLLPDLDQSRHSCCNQRHSHIRQVSYIGRYVSSLMMPKEIS